MGKCREPFRDTSDTFAVDLVANIFNIHLVDVAISF